MSYLSSSTREELLEILEIKEAELTAARATFLERLGSPVEEYRFNSGDGGNQWARKTSTRQLKELIDQLEREVALIKTRLRGAGLTNIVLRRR